MNEFDLIRVRKYSKFNEFEIRIFYEFNLI